MTPADELTMIRAAVPSRDGETALEAVRRVVQERDEARALAWETGARLAWAYDVCAALRCRDSATYQEMLDAREHTERATALLERLRALLTCDMRCCAPDCSAAIALRHAAAIAQERNAGELTDG